MLEEDIQERIKLLFLTLKVDQELLRKNFLFLSRVSQPHEIEGSLSIELDGGKEQNASSKIILEYSGGTQFSEVAHR